ncbi:DEAD/DEAH box helicase [Streptomyces sp. CB01201]|uniref:DEAD/DEAH box helicase n=1 Tax=Streptomyces sp. CB01201 TaxID=2020324 RepID=UPI000C27E625|nr:DEAD/DEAH box helicase [Streptomyces sp. CB01201]PJN03169.1 DEAD/DEAH box helicase [Streptomyces sp. CB01201]
MTTFRELGILPETAEALEAVGIVSPFPIQELTLPVALSGTDIIGQAKTGTGKTLGFGLPILERVTVPADVEAGRATKDRLTNTPQALVVVPTRELCQQVTNDLLTAGKVRNVRVLAIYGGRAYEPQVEALKKGVDVIVGTPGRLLDLAGQKKLDLSHVKTLVLDEADEMLDLGFLPDVEKIIQLLPAKRQTMLFSATMPGAVIGLARRYMSQPTHIRATSPDDEGTTVANTAQYVYRAHSMDKPEMVARILQAEGRGLAMIFCRTKRTAADIAEQLAKRGFASGAVHGDLGQGAREQALRAFRNGKVDVLVCTDVAARGIDVEGVTHVINYQSPEEEKTYLHRIGRTGRAGKKGIAITLVDWDDIPRWQLINKALDLKFPDPVETYSTSPHLFEELKIPAGTKGVLPRGERTRAGLAAEAVEDLGETGGRGRKSAAAAPVVTEERPARTRTPRQRRRTRGGTQLEGGEVTAPPVATPVAEATETESVTEQRTPRRRRRTRVGAPSTAPQAAAPVIEAAPMAVAVAEAPAKTEPVRKAEPTVKAQAVRKAEPRRRSAPVAAPPVVEPVEAKAARRRRVRKATEPEVGFVTPESAALELARAAKARTTAAMSDVAEAPAAAVAVAEAPVKPRRTRTKKAAEPVVEAAPVEAAPVAEAEAPAKPRRTRAKKVVETAPEAVAETAAEAEAPAKPRRTRKKAAEAVVETVEAPASEAPAAEAPAKPRRTRAKKAVESVEAAAATEAPAEVAEAPAKPRRTRAKKVVETAPEAVAETAAEAEAPAKPRRTRKKAAEAVVEAPAAEAEAPAKPRRTRAKKAAVAPEA